MRGVPNASTLGMVTKVEWPRVWVIPRETPGYEVEVLGIVQGWWSPIIRTELSAPVGGGTSGSDSPQHFHPYLTDYADAKHNHFAPGVILDDGDLHHHPGWTTTTHTLHSHPFVCLPHDHAITPAGDVIKAGDRVLLAYLGEDQYVIAGRLH